MWFKTTPNYVQNKAGNIHTVFFACNGALDAYPELIVSIYKGVPGSTTQKITVKRYVGTTVTMTFYGEVPANAYVDDGRWHHLAYVKNGNNNRLFIDGIKIKESNATNGTLTATSAGYLCFGKNVPVATDQGHTFRGSMDRLRFYNRAITDAEVAELYRQDSDRDGFWDVVENEWTGVFPMSPFYWQSPEVDTDGDGLPDAWERLYGLDPLNPVGINGGAGDLDGDGVSNLDEFQNKTKPTVVDTDGDGVSDAVEIAQASDPNNPADQGQPPSDPVETVTFRTGGDYATWRMNIKGLGPRDTRDLFVTAPKFNEFITKGHKLLKNNAYRITLRHIASRPQDTPPWFCWEAQVEGLPATGTFSVQPGDQLGARNLDGKLFLVKNHWIVDNRQGLLTSHLHSKGSNVVGSDEFGSGTGSLTAFLMPLTLQRDEDFLNLAWQPISGQLTKALPGERINLQLNMDRFSPGLVVNDFNWVLPASTFSEYQPTRGQAQVVKMAGTLLTQNPVGFHFSESGNQPVELNFKVEGLPFQVSTNLDVQKPVSTFTTQTGVVRMGLGTTGAHSLGFLGAVNPRFGVQYISSVTTPQGWSQGQFVYAQLIRTKRNYTNPPNGNATVAGDGVTWKHDGDFPYSGVSAIFPADGQIHSGVGDSPSDGTVSRSTVKVVDAFQTYLMFRPAGAASCYVPLRKINWNWGGEASATNNWTVAANPVSVVDAAGAETFLPPEWNSNAGDDLEQNAN